MKVVELYKPTVSRSKQGEMSHNIESIKTNPFIMREEKRSKMLDHSENVYSSIQTIVHQNGNRSLEMNSYKEKSYSI